MKKLLIIIVGLLVAMISANAQYISGSAPTDPAEQAAFMQNINIIALSLAIGGFSLLEIAAHS